MLFQLKISCALYFAFGLLVCNVQGEWLQARIGALVGIAVDVKEGNLDLVKADPNTLAVSTLFSNVTTVKSGGVTPEFDTAYCSKTGVFMIAINDVDHPRVVGVDLKTGKVKGIIKVNGIYVNNLECDTLTGFGVAYVYILGFKHHVVSLNFARETHTVLMSSSYKSYGGSAIDPVTSRFFTVAVLPFFDAFNYSVSTIEYRSAEEKLTPPFRGYSIGDMVFDLKSRRPFAVVQSPPQVAKGPAYRSLLAALDIRKGGLEQLSPIWPGQQPIRNTAIAFDPVSRIAYVFFEKVVRAVNVNRGTVLYSKSTESLPWPSLHYDWVA